MKAYGGYLKLESFGNMSSSLGPELTDEVANLRKVGDYSQESMEKSAVADIISTHTGMNVTFIVSEEVGVNAFARLPFLDNSHPFFTQMGFEPWFIGEHGKVRVEDGPLEGTVDVKRYKVSGALSKIEAPIVVGLALIKDKSLTNEEVAAIILHEAGHHFTYFQLLGNIIRDSWLISNASKIAVGSETPEVKTKVLVKTKEQLGIEQLDIPSLLASAQVTRKDAVEYVLVSNSLMREGSQSGTNYYDVRTVEQIADAFVAFHGMGRPLASSLVKFSRMSNSISSRSFPVYLVAELFKTIFTLAMFFTLPITTIIWLVGMVPGCKIYDDPEARVNTLKQQLNSALRQAKTADEKTSIVEQIKAIDACQKELRDKRTFYVAIFETITPIGRKRFSQEKQQEMIKNMLFNDFQAKALQLGN